MFLYRKVFLFFLICLVLCFALTGCFDDPPPVDPAPSVVEPGTPATGTDTPATGTDVPATGTDTPATGTDTPATGTDVPATDTDIPATGTNAPTDPPDSTLTGFFATLRLLFVELGACFSFFRDIFTVFPLAIRILIYLIFGAILNFGLMRLVVKVGG